MLETITKKISAYERILFELIICDVPCEFQIVLSDGSIWHDIKDPSFTLYINDSSFLMRAVLCENYYVIGKAFIKKQFDVSGDITKAIILKDKFSKFWLNRCSKIRLIKVLLILYTMCIGKDCLINFYKVANSLKNIAANLKHNFTTKIQV